MQLPGFCSSTKLRRLSPIGQCFHLNRKPMPITFVEDEDEEMRKKAEMMELKLWQRSEDKRRRIVAAKWELVVAHVLGMWKGEYRRWVWADVA